MNAYRKMRCLLSGLVLIGMVCKASEASSNGSSYRQAEMKSVVGQPAVENNEGSSSPETDSNTQKKDKRILPPKVILGNIVGQDSQILNGNQDAYAALMYINHLNHVIAKLKNFDDLLILQQEYENLTDNNLNLEVIQDEVTVQLITQLLDIVSELEKENFKGMYAKVALEEEKRKAIFKAIPSGSMILSPNPVVLATNIAVGTLTSVQNYYNAKAEAKGKNDDKLVDIAQNKLDYITKLDRELFFAQWRLIQKYHLRDVMRITRNENELFLGFAKVLNPKGEGQSSAGTDDNPKLVWKIFKNNEDDMANSPFYWVTRASAAAAIKNKNMQNICLQDIRYSCERYFDLLQIAPIIRKDITACSMALLYVSTLDKPKSEEDIAYYRDWLKFVEKTARIPEWQIKFSVAQCYANRIGDKEKAMALVRKTFLEVHTCLTVWERSGKKENIFYSAPSFTKAMKKMSNELKGLEDKVFPNYHDEAEKLLPTMGWFWLKDAWLDLILQMDDVQRKAALEEWETMTKPPSSLAANPINKVLAKVADPKKTSDSNSNLDLPTITLCGNEVSLEGLNAELKLEGIRYLSNGKEYNLGPVKNKSATYILKGKTSSEPASLVVVAYDEQCGFGYEYRFEIREGKAELKEASLKSPWRGDERSQVFWPVPKSKSFNSRP